MDRRAAVFVVTTSRRAEIRDVDDRGRCCSTKTLEKHSHRESYGRLPGRVWTERRGGATRARLPVAHDCRRMGRHQQREVVAANQAGRPAIYGYAGKHKVSQLKA